MASKYRSHIAARDSQSVPSFKEALRFFQQLRDPKFDVPERVKEFQGWLAYARLRDQRNYAAHGNTRGLINHIKVTHNWMDDSNDMQRVYHDGKRARSDVDTGTQVDAELGALHAGSTAVTSPHKYTQWLIIYFCQRRWLPLAFQVPIWSTDNSSVRTHADAMFYNLETERFVLLELKTGHDNRYDDVLRERGPLDYFEKTLRTMCHLQLGWMYFEIDRCGAPWPCDAYVLRVSSERGVRRPEPLLRDVAAYYRLECAAAGLSMPHLAAHTPIEEPDGSDASSHSSSGDDSEESVESKRRRQLLEE